MLMIRRDQIAQLFDLRQAESAASYADYFRAAVPELTGPLWDGDLKNRLRAGVADARRYGVETGPALPLYLLLCLVLGSDFFRQADIDRFLRSEVLDMESKLDMLLQGLAARIKSGIPLDPGAGGAS